MIESEYHLLYAQEERHWWFVSKRNFLRVMLDTYLPTNRKRRLLDVGCGTGRNLQLLKAYGSVTGVDKSPIALAYCKKRGIRSVQSGTAERLPFRAGQFDVVTILDVLYHKNIKDDRVALQQAYKVLRPEGIVIITDCAHQWLYGPHDVRNLARERYTLSELERKLTDEGFCILRSSYIYMFPFPVFALERLLAKLGLTGQEQTVEEVHAEWVNTILIKLEELEAGLLRRWNLPFGSSVLLVAQKKV